MCKWWQKQPFVAQCWLKVFWKLLAAEYTYHATWISLIVGLVIIPWTCCPLLSSQSRAVKWHFLFCRQLPRLVARQKLVFAGCQRSLCTWCDAWYVKWFCCNGFIFVIRTILCCNVRSLLAAPSRLWVLFCVLFLSMCLCKLQIRAGCSELLQLKSTSLAWCVLHLEEVLEGLVFLWLPWATQEHRCLTQCWVSLRKQNAASWALSMFCVLKQFLRVSCR